jgi:hypothetical protein
MGTVNHSAASFRPPPAIVLNETRVPTVGALCAGECGDAEGIPYAWVCRTFITTNGTEVIVGGFIPEGRRSCCHIHAPSEVFRFQNPDPEFP